MCGWAAAKKRTTALRLFLRYLIAPRSTVEKRMVRLTPGEAMVLAKSLAMAAVKAAPSKRRGRRRPTRQPD